MLPVSSGHRELFHFGGHLECKIHLVVVNERVVATDFSSRGFLDSSSFSFPNFNP